MILVCCTRKSQTFFLLKTTKGWQEMNIRLTDTMDIEKKGIGKKLFDEVKAYAKKMKVNYIELMVWKFNQDVMKFYKKMGMKTRTKRMEYKI